MGNIINRTFALIKKKAVSHLTDSKHVIDSRVRFPNLINREAIINSSEITGNTSVGKGSDIYKSVIHGQVKIAEFAKLHEVLINGRGKVSIGKNTSVWGPNTDLYSLHHPIDIGNFCSIARNVSIQEYNHIHSRCTSYFIFKNVFNEEDGIYLDTESKGSIIIGHDVWVGAHSVILSGAQIGTGAVIGANSVVSGHIPPYAFAIGSPAKIVKYRFEKDIIDKLLAIEWWHWTHDKIIANRSLFEGVLTMEKLNSIID